MVEQQTGPYRLGTAVSLLQRQQVSRGHDTGTPAEDQALSATPPLERPRRVGSEVQGARDQG